MFEAGSNPWTVTSSRVVYRNPWTELVEDQLVDAAGRTGMYGYLAKKDYAIICAITDADEILLVRQWRHAFGRSSWELPCGACDGDAPLAAAQREFREETNYQAEQWEALSQFHNADARVAGEGHAFIARGLSIAGTDAREHSEQDLICEAVPFAEAIAASLDGRISNVASRYTILHCAMALKRLG